MTWDELANKISEMTPEQRKEPVVYVEPYDDGSAVGVDVTTADFDIHSEWGSDADEDSPVVIKQGSYHLW